MGSYYFGIGRQDRYSRCWEVSTAISGVICASLKEEIIKSFDILTVYYPGVFSEEMIQWVKEYWL